MTDAPLDPYEGLVPAESLMSPATVFVEGFQVHVVGIVRQDDVTQGMFIEFVGVGSGSELAGRNIGAHIMIHADGVDPFVKAVTAAAEHLRTVNSTPEEKL